MSWKFKIKTKKANLTGEKELRLTIELEYTKYSNCIRISNCDKEIEILYRYRNRYVL